jgi:carboxyl-terminal processing protease
MTFVLRPWPRIAGITVGLTALLAAGCAPTVGPGEDSAENVFSVAMEALDDRYLDPIKPDVVMMAGLSRLSKADGRLTVWRTPGSVILAVNGDAVVERSAPAPDNLYGWAEMGARIVADARVASPQLSTVSQDSIFKPVFEGFVEGLDRYSRYLPPDDASSSRASREGFGGIGIQIGKDGSDIVVRTIYPNRPAILAGLKANDRITHVDGHPMTGLAISDAVKHLRGRVGEAVKVTMYRPDTKKTYVRDIVRDYIVASTVDIKNNGNILEIRLSGFNTGTVGALRRAIVKSAREIGRIDGVVFDLRGNPGGLLDQAIAVSDLFLTRGRIISTKGRHPDSNQTFDASPGEVLPGVPIVVVINGRSASAAEIVAVALRDSGRAAVVGSSSYGKGTVQTIIRLPNHGEFNITWARLYAPSGQTLDRQGIVPAICTNRPVKALTALISSLKQADGHAPIDPAGLRLQAQMPHFSTDRQTACKPSDLQGDQDLVAARLLLRNKPLYALSVAHPAPNVAER